MGDSENVKSVSRFNIRLYEVSEICLFINQKVLSLVKGAFKLKTKKHKVDFIKICFCLKLKHFSSEMFHLINYLMLKLYCLVKYKN